MYIPAGEAGFPTSGTINSERVNHGSAARAPRYEPAPRHAAATAHPRAGPADRCSSETAIKKSLRFSTSPGLPALLRPRKRGESRAAPRPQGCNPHDSRARYAKFQVSRRRNNNNNKRIKVVPPRGPHPPSPGRTLSPALAARRSPGLSPTLALRAKLAARSSPLQAAPPRPTPAHHTPPRPAPPRRPPPGPTTEAGKGWRRRGAAGPRVVLPRSVLPGGASPAPPSSMFFVPPTAEPPPRPGRPGPPRPQVPAPARSPSAASPRLRGFRPAPPIGSGERGNPANGAPGNGEKSRGESQWGGRERLPSGPRCLGAALGGSGAALG